MYCGMCLYLSSSSHYPVPFSPCFDLCTPVVLERPLSWNAQLRPVVLGANSLACHAFYFLFMEARLSTHTRTQVSAYAEVQHYHARRAGGPNCSHSILLSETSARQEDRSGVRSRICALALVYGRDPTVPIAIYRRHDSANILLVALSSSTHWGPLARGVTIYQCDVGDMFFTACMSILPRDSNSERASSACEALTPQFSFISCYRMLFRHASTRGVRCAGRRSGPLP